MKFKSVITGVTVWFVALTTVVYANHDSHSTSSVDIHTGIEPLYTTGSPLVASLLFIIGILLIGIVAVWRNSEKRHEKNNDERQELALQNLEVLMNLDKTIAANTQAKLIHGGIPQ